MSKIQKKSKPKTVKPEAAPLGKYISGDPTKPRGWRYHANKAEALARVKTAQESRRNPTGIQCWKIGAFAAAVRP